MNLNNWFDKGLSSEDYMARLDNHRDGFYRIKEHFNVPTEDLETFNDVKDLRAIVLAAEWCGHCMLDIPIFLHIAKAANISTRFLIRDDNLELMDQYLTDEKRFIPIIIFIDSNGNEISKWGPMSPGIRQFVDDYKKDLPAKDDANYEEAFRKYVNLLGEAFQTDENLWNDVYQDIKKVIVNSN